MMVTHRRAFAMAATALLLGSCGPSSGCAPIPTPSADAYISVPHVVGPARTAPIDPTWVQPDGSLAGVADGVYWGAASWDAAGVRFELTQAFFGDECSRQFTGPDDCLGDVGVLGEPHGVLVVATTESPAVTVVAEPLRVQPDGTHALGAFRIGLTELRRLLAGQPPSAAAPAGFEYVPFAYFVTVTDGRVTAAAQREQS